MQNKNWNNLNRNANGSTINKHSELHNYHILHSTTYTHRQPNRTPSNIDIFLTNAPFLHNCHTIDDLPSNHLPIILTLQTTKSERTQNRKQQTDWKAYIKLCDKININPHITNTHEIDTEINNITHHIQNEYHKTTKNIPARKNISSTDLFLHYLIKETK